MAEKMLDVISILLKLLKLVLYSMMCSIFENVLRAFEKNVYFASLGWKAQYVSDKFIWSRASFSAAISLLIFCLEDLSIFDSGVLNFPTIIVLLSISFFKFSKIFLIYLDDPLSCTYMFIIFMSSWWILPFSILKCPSVSFSSFFFFEVYFVGYKYCYWSFFSFPFAWNIFSNPSLSVCVGVLFWSVYPVVRISVGHVFLSIQLFCAFWLGHIIHLRLRLLLIGTYSLSLYPLCTCVPLSLSLFPFIFLKQYL